jgi:transcription antitermination protein NusB
MSRISARAAAMQLVYEKLLGGESDGETLHNLIAFTPEEGDEEFIQEILAGVSSNDSEIDHVIEVLSSSRDIQRIARVDLSILRVAVYELLYRKIDPDSAVINEAVTLANRFSEPASTKFINGILGSVVRGKLAE